MEVLFIIGQNTYYGLCIQLSLILYHGQVYDVKLEPWNVYTDM